MIKVIKVYEHDTKVQCSLNDYVLYLLQRKLNDFLFV